jgi:hypothetical protein
MTVFSQPRLDSAARRGICVGGLSPQREIWRYRSPHVLDASVRTPSNRRPQRSVAQAPVLDPFGFKTIEFSLLRFGKMMRE